MTERFFSWLRSHYRLILPYVLTVILGMSVYAVYQVGTISVWTLAVILMSAAVFVLCEFVNKHHFAGGVILTVVIFAALRLFIGLIWGGDYGETFRKWFLTGADQVETRFEYLLALLISLVPFIGVVVYYFSVVLYRMSFLTLASMIPCVLYVKVLFEIDNVYICLIAMLNVIIFMMHSRSRLGEGRRQIGMNAAVISACAFTFIVLVVSSLIPKKSDAIFYDRFEALFMDSGYTVEISEDFSLLSEFSGNADSFRNFSNRRMYSVYGSENVYFKRQNFDYYDFEMDAWYSDEFFSEPDCTDFEWKERAVLLNLEGLKQAFISAEGYESGFLNKYGLERLAEYDRFSDDMKQITVQPEDFGAVYYIAPQRTVNITANGLNKEQIYVTKNGAFRNKLNKSPTNSGYIIDYYSELGTRFLWHELGGADFDDEASEQMLTELVSVLEDNNDVLAAVAGAFLDELEYSLSYDRYTAENTAMISDRIRELAREVTAGCTYDWEKADALQNYFIRNDYVYDINFIASDTSPENFLFNTKRGTCSDFASAFALMGRSVGLTVRYAEGYSPDISSREGVYIIRDSCSHAYPEVFIQNEGWITYEPTVSSPYARLTEDDGGFGAAVDYDLVFAMCIVAGLMLAGVLAVIIMYPVISERLFIGRALRSEPSACAVMIYRRICEKQLSGLVKNPWSYTPREMAHECERLFGADIDAVAEAVERSAYCGEETDESSERMVEIYEQMKISAKEYRKIKKSGKKENNAEKRSE